ncbi:hypothetical protein F2Q70_00034977 [Brassica cretica]|uniref:SNF2 N-terminal domain-containing protein n=1 Tax=Brassica cretica TaxID=69181 RepID=A0A8S9JXA5_BRACR|nr:hypothetical protein F2Q70_00034977 [Brassica cretica]
MSNQELSGLENPSAVSLLKGNKQHRSKKDYVHMVKLYSWRNKKNILGISYSLYEKLASGETQKFRKMLLDFPELLVLDEGHTPRNHNSCIWKVLTEVKTEKRIILSGTPFQNNFKELSNIENECVVSSRLGYDLVFQLNESIDIWRLDLRKEYM